MGWRLIRQLGERWKSICWSVGLARAAAHEHWLYALRVIAWQLKGRAAPKGVERRELIGRLGSAKEKQASPQIRRAHWMDDESRWPGCVRNIV